MSAAVYVIAVVAAAIAVTVVVSRLGLPRAARALPLLLAAAAIAVPALLARAATAGDGVEVTLPGRPLQTVLRAGSVFVYTADDAGRPILTALYPPDGRTRFVVRGDDAVVAEDGSVLVRDGNAFVAHDASGRRSWRVADPPGGPRPLVVAFAAGRAILADRSPGPGDAVRYDLRGIDAAGTTAWTRTFLGSDSPFAEVPEGLGPARLREDIVDLAVLTVERAEWDGRAIRGRDAYLDLDGRVLDGPTSADTRFLWALDGRLVVGRRTAGDGCRLVGYVGRRQAWVTDDCRSFAALRPTAARDEPVFRDADGRLRRVDPVDGTVVELQVGLTPSRVLPCADSGGFQRLAPTDGERLLTLSGRTVGVFSLVDRDGPDLTHVVPGDGAFRACIGPGTLVVSRRVESANPFLGEDPWRVEVFDVATGRRTAALVTRTAPVATDGWAPGRTLLLQRGGRLTLLGRIAI